MPRYASFWNLVVVFLALPLANSIDSIPSRQLQNVFTHFWTSNPDNNPDPEEPPTAPSAPFVDKRSQDVRSCAGDVETTESVTLILSYDVETTDDLTDEEHETVMEAVQAEILNSLFYTKCRRRNLESSSSSSSLRPPSGRQLGITSFSSGGAASWQTSCNVTNDQAASCDSYESPLTVGFNDQGTTKEDVISTVVEKIVSDMASGIYLVAMNQALGSSWGPTVTSMAYTGHTEKQPRGSIMNGFSSFEYAQKDESGLSLMGKGMVPVLGLLFVAMLAALFLAYRARRRLRSSSNKEIATFVDDDDDPYFSSSADRYFSDSSSSGRSFVAEEPTNLARRSPQMDVHSCSRPTCEVCTSSVPKGGMLETIPESLSNPSERSRSASTERNLLDDAEGTPNDPHPDVETRLNPRRKLDTVYCINGTPPPRQRRGLGGILGLKRNRRAIVEVEEAPSPEPSPQQQETVGFQDEPNKVAFVPVNSQPRYHVDKMGVKRMVVDPHGYVRNEIEL